MENFDLYDKVNAVWMHQTKIPDDRSEWGTFSIITERIEKRLKDLLSASAENQSPELKILRSFYEKFRNVSSATDKNELLEIATVTDKIFNCESITDIGNVLGILTTQSANPLFRVYAAEDPRDTDHNRLNIVYPSLVLPDKEYYLNPIYADYVGSYAQHASSIFSIMNSVAGKNYSQSTKLSFDEMGKVVVMIETEIAKSLRSVEERRDIEAIYSRMPILSFIENIKLCFDEFANSAEENTQYCDIAKKLWQNYFDTMLIHTNKTLTQYVSSLEVIIPADMIVYDIVYFQKLTRIFMQTDLTQLKIYLAYRYVCSVHSRIIVKSFHEADHEFFDIRLEGLKKPETTEDKALKQTQYFLGDLLCKEYSSKYFSEQTVQHVRMMIDKISEQLRLSIESGWMTKKTKEKALRKLDTMKYKIGKPTKYDDRSELINHLIKMLVQNTAKNNVSIIRLIKSYYFIVDTLRKIDTNRDPNKWHIESYTVNAYYDPTSNEIVITAGILEDPIFNPNPQSLTDTAKNYGSMGIIIGHEIAHGFDDQGRKYDHKGNIQNWWTEADRQKFNSLAKSVVEQYSKYTVDINGTSINVNAHLTLGENIADLVGVNLGLRALQTITTEPQYLREFFESYTTLWRRKTTSDKMLSRMASDPHSPERYRVWTVGNIDLFYEVYSGVNSESDMYIDPAKRVVIY